MVDDEIVAAGVKNPRVIQAMRDTPRHEFVPLGLPQAAYFDMALPIGEAQTISPPFIVAYMTEALDPQPDDKVLEIGTGSGYQAAVLVAAGREVYTIEIVETLGHTAAQTLKRLHYDNVHVKVGDGYLGWPEHAPFDKIIVTCSPEKVPPALVEQLREGGRMVIPVGERYQQTLYLHEESRRQDGVRGPAADALRAHDRQGGGEPRGAARPGPPDDPQRRLRGSHGRSAGGGRLALSAAVESRDAASGAPEGQRYVTFSNATPGRNAHALQGFAVDGRKVAQMELSVRGPRARTSGPGKRAADAGHRHHVLRREPRHGRRGDPGSLARHALTGER